MPRPFQQLSIEQFSELLSHFQFKREIDAVHLHHTWRPNRAMYRGLPSIEAMYQFHTVRNGWSDIAQHVTIAPDGMIWTGRNWNDPPASSTGYNGNREHGPFMIEMIGDFDHGKDPFDGPQKDAAIAVVALLQQRFGLHAESLRFHNHMTRSKTCPGTGIDYSATLEAVKNAHQALIASPVGRGDLAAIDADSVRAISSGLRDEELLAETADDAMGRAEANFFAGDDGYTMSRALGAGAAARGFSATDLAALRPHAVSMRQGHWDTHGIFNTTAGDVDALFFEHAKAAVEGLAKGKKLKFVIYAHGGLVSEQHGLEQAQAHIDWWKQSAAEGIYPIYFIWKTGLAETIGQVLGFGSRDRAMGQRAAITDPALAEIARRLGGESLWSGMKRDAEQAVLPDGAATYTAMQMKKFCDLYKGRMELHAVGHSAGAVFHSHYIPMSTVSGNPYFKSTSFMAPAVRVDTFIDLLTMDDGAGRRKLKDEVGDLTLFTMKKDFESRDDCAGLYRQSLLYLIYHAFEPEDKTPILGLEESIRADKQLTTLFGLGGNPAGRSEVVWSPSQVDSGRSATRAIHHGDFSSDAPSLNSILRRILDLSDTDPIHSYPSGGRGLNATWDIWAPPEDLPGFSAPASSTPAAPQVPAPAANPAPVQSGAVSGKKALCVGIDNYASPNRLTGCVHDAQTWADVLRRNGFETQLLLDGNATADGIMSALRHLVQSSHSGDVIVFQYSGHGTTVPDEAGRTVDGVEEAMVPFDFTADNPHLLMDFDLSAVFRGLPAGVNLTCFIDCCHSGTITRLLVGAPAQPNIAGRDQRARFLTLSPQEVAAVHRYRANFAATSRGNTAGGQELMRDVVFAACRPDEVAWEMDGQGEFTRRAAAVLASGFAGMTNEQFAAAITQAFGATPRQHPLLDCAPAAKSQLLLAH